MRNLYWLLLGFAIGYLTRDRLKPPITRRIILMPKIVISATQPVTVRAVVAELDAENNVVDTKPLDDSSGLTVVIENDSGEFGTIEGGNVFNPGAAGATGTLHVTATVDGVEVNGRVDIELTHGDVTHTEVEVQLTPVVPIETPSTPTAGGDGSAPAENTGGSTPSTPTEPETPSTPVEPETPANPNAGEAEPETPVADVTNSVVDQIVALGKDKVDELLEEKDIDVPEDADLNAKAKALADSGYIPEATPAATGDEVDPNAGGDKEDGS